MQSMGIHCNYKWEYRRAWIFYALSIITINLAEAMTLIFDETYYRDAPHDTIFFLQLIIFDILQLSVWITIAVSLHLLLHNVYTRLAAVNLLLRYVDLMCVLNLN